MTTKKIVLKHREQPVPGDCLPACVVMVLDHLGVRYRYNRIRRLLRTIPNAGTPYSNVRYLAKLRISVLHERGTLDDLRHHLNNGSPCIIFLKTGDLPYWDEDVPHAVVLVGMDEQFVYLHDPELAIAPVSVSIGDFDLAWLAHGERYAVLSK